ncbi:hypothetical protein LXL04_004874 [Taraxacum kok-saghyz]
MEREWREVRRKGVSARKGHGKVEDSSLTSFFVTNLPGDVTRQELWKLCDKMGRLSDIYIAGRRDASGSFFAFVKFAKVERAESIEAALNETSCRSRKLVANVARHSRNVPQREVKRPVQTERKQFRAVPRDSRTFADVASGRSVPAPQASPPPIALSVIQEIQEWTGKSVLLGEAKCFDTLCNFPAVLALDGFDIAETKYLRGMQIMVKFRSDRAASVVKANKSIWLKWFQWVEHIDKKYLRYERIAWVKITGLPFLAWDDKNFAAMAGNFGKVLVNATPFWDNCNLSNGKVCILTAKRAKINEEIDIKLEGSLHRIGVFEIDDDWVPFRPFSAKEDSDSGEDEEGSDAVSDTWHQDGMDLENGEIDPSVGVADGRNGDDSSELGSSKCGNFNSNLHGKLSQSVGFEGPHGEKKNYGNEVEGACAHNYDLIQGKDVLVGPNDKAREDTPLIPNLDGPSGSPIHTQNPKSPLDTQISSSPDFGPGDSAVKRRRLKLKKRTNAQGHLSSRNNFRQSPKRAAGSIDLNRQVSSSQISNSVNSGSPSHTTISSSAEIDCTVDIGNQLGFQFDKNNQALHAAINGGGAKNGSL